MHATAYATGNGQLLAFPLVFFPWRAVMQPAFKPGRRRLLKVIGATVPATATVLAGAQGPASLPAPAHEVAGNATRDADSVALFFNHE